MRNIIFIFFLTIYSSLLPAQSFTQLTFGTDSSLEVMTWNSEHFPKNGQTTISLVSQIIEALNVDLIALQEVSDTNLLRQMVNSLPGYQCYSKSVKFAGLAYIYKNTVIQADSIFEIYTSATYSKPFPRLPMVMNFHFLNKEFFIINNHLKCCGDGILDLNNSSDEENRRYLAANLLKQYIDSTLPDKQVLVVGDMNDLIAEPAQNNVFHNFINDTAGYLFTDMEIAQGSSSGWSYPTWPSHLDHILITNELFAAFKNVNADVKAIKIDACLFGGWNEYENNISDHRPVAVRLMPDSCSAFVHHFPRENRLSIIPNPAGINVSFVFPIADKNAKIEIYNAAGQFVKMIRIADGQNLITLPAVDFYPGIYYLRYFIDDINIVSGKMLIIRD